jgi:hypothetical protein
MLTWTALASAFDSARRSTMNALPARSLLLRILDVLVEWQMRQSLRAICRGQKPCGLPH